MRQLGSLDSFSAFPYENNMSNFRKYCRKTNFPLQQFSNRMAEIEARETNLHRTQIHFSKLIDSSTQVCAVYNRGLFCLMLIPTAVSIVNWYSMEFCSVWIYEIIAVFYTMERFASLSISSWTKPYIIWL